MTYIISNYEISKNLKLFARKGGQGKYTLGECHAEFLAEDDSFNTCEPLSLDPREPIEKIDIDRETGLNGKLALQTKDLQYCVDVEQKNEWLANGHILATEDDVTVKAIALHSLLTRTKKLNLKIIKGLAEHANIMYEEALWVYYCHRDDGIFFEVDQWRTCLTKFSLRPTSKQLNTLVEAGVMKFDGKLYSTTDRVRELIP